MPEPIDRLSSLLERFRVRAELFHAGPLCGVTHFAAEPGRGFLHVLRRGQMLVTHQKTASGPREQLHVVEPTLLFYPRPLEHHFHNAPLEGSDFVCATMAFDGGGSHPLARALPAVIALPLTQLVELEYTLALLFRETERLRCGQRLLADRLFEVLLIQLLRWLLDRPEQAGIDTGLLMGLGDDRLARTLTALHEQPGAAWSLERMAELAGMSRSAFAARFKLVVGETPADYLTGWRLSIAESRLKSGKSVKNISDELGYANASALSRVFIQKRGLSPRDWLKSTK